MSLNKRISKLEGKKSERQVSFFFEREDGSVLSTDKRLMFDNRERLRLYLKKEKLDHPVTIFTPIKQQG
jgi:hypothetical protein